MHESCGETPVKGCGPRAADASEAPPGLRSQRSQKRLPHIETLAVPDAALVPLQEFVENAAAQSQLISCFGDTLYAESGVLKDESRFPGAALRPRQPRSSSPIVATFAFKSRMKFVVNIVRDLSTNVRDFSAMTLQ